MPSEPRHGSEVATLAGGCFWCLQPVFSELRGVEKTEVGYAGGDVANPSYEDVCTDTTGHAEAVQITFDPAVISYEDLLRIFFTVHDPTTLNRQGADTGTQYRSAVFTHSPEQKATVGRVLAELQAQRVWDDPVVTEVTPFANFYRAEEYHQDYYRKNPYAGYCMAVISPKVRKFRKHYADRLKA
ncbi:MAG TPA: peptide-methionine (S)-S-oxide reductase MsrA [Thermoplasmata archaeon]|nr:peptide-methionine (S)-S-oxide reductase MsrA [Thermoplasmata archaeon]